MKPFSITADFDLRDVLQRLSSEGAASLRILDEDFRLALVQEAQGYTYTPEDEMVGSGNRLVRQQLGAFEAFPEASRYSLLQRSFQELLDRRLANLRAYPFASPLKLDSAVLQQYRPGSIGITPHRDGLRFINLVCIFVVAGRGRFCVCADRSGRDAREISAVPGSVVLMRAPGFLGTTDRPFHFVTDIRETRYTLGLRQKRPPS